MKTKQTKNSGISYVIPTRDGQPTSISLVVNNRAFTLGASQSNFHSVLGELKKPKQDAKRILSLLSSAEALSDFASKGVSIHNGKVYFKGSQMNGAVVNRILDFHRQNLPCEPTIAFLGNLPDNQAQRDAAYKFLENEGLTLTPDGCILAYKGVRGNWTSAHQNNLPSLKAVLIDNYIRFKPGDKPRCNPQDCDSDPHVHCSKGLHVGSHAFAKAYVADYDRNHGHMVLVKINPKDIVSVPTDTREKMRVCAMEVVCDLADPDAGKVGKALAGGYTNVKKLKRKLAIAQKRAGKKRRAVARKNSSRNRAVKRN